MCALACFIFLSTLVLGQQVPDGRYRELYENGRTKTSGRYKHGIKTGTWAYYTETGMTQKKERWKKGILVLTFYYNEKGRIASITNQKGETRFMPDCNCR